MPSTYVLVFLLGLLPLSTFITADQSGAAAPIDDQGRKPFMNRPYMRSSRSKIQNHLRAESVEKPLEKTSILEDAMMHEAEVKLSGHRLPGEKVEEKWSQDENEDLPTGQNVAMKRSEKKTPDEDKHADFPSRAERTKEANKYKVAGSPSKAKRTDFYDLEGMNS